MKEKEKALSVLKKEYKNSLADLNSKKIDCIVPAEEDIRRLNEKISDMRARFGTLGFFKKREKKELENDLIEAEDALKEAESQREQQKEELIKSIDDEILTLRNKYEEQAKSLSESISSLKKEISDSFYKDSFGPSQIQTRKEKRASDEKLVYDVLKRIGESSPESLLREKELKGFTNQKMIHMLMNLMRKGCVQRRYITMTAYYEVVHDYKA